MLSRAEQEQIDREIFNGDFELQLDEAVELCTARSNTFSDIYATTINNEQLMTTQTSATSSLDDFMRDIDRYSIPIPSNTLRRVMRADTVTFSCQHVFKGGCAGAGFFGQSKFCKMLKKEIQENYSVETTITKSTDNSNLEDPIYIINFKSEDENKIYKARASLEALFSTLETKPVDNQAGFWVKYPDCIRIVQAYGDQNEHLHILCDYETIGLMISYFNRDKSEVFLNLCTNNATLDKIIQEKFLTLDISLPSTSDLTTDNNSYLAQDILKLESELRYQAILIILEQRRIRLFGLTDLVKEVENQIEEIKKKYASNTVKLNIGPREIHYLMNVYNDELKALESTYYDATIIVTLKNGEFIAPSYIQDTIERKLMVLATLCAPIYFEVHDEAFCAIAHNECPNLIKIGRQYKCQIEIQENSESYTCEIPKATRQDHISNKLTAAVIKIHKDDLAEQRVDLVVVCSTSMFLRDGILEKAGPPIIQEYIETAKISSSEPFETNSGQLQCRKLLFLPWEINQTSQQAFYQSIRNFVRKAVQHAIKAHHTSIAFPSIGCGKLNVDKNVVANEMLVEAQKQLLVANVLLQIIFVILPEQSDVYEAFQTKLENLQRGNVEIKDVKIPYNLTTLTITIISSNEEKQKECQNALKDYVQNSISVIELLGQDVLRKWTQPAINTFYKFCLNRNVVPVMNITIGYLKLSGSKESVRDAENEYLREQTKQSEQARLLAIARNIIWAYKSDGNTSEKYSPELNARIEDAHSSNTSSFNYADDKSGEEYTIDFKTMTETCMDDQIQRQVFRHADFNLPEHWDVQSDNVAQFKVQVNSTEYNKIRTLFDQTMADKYVEILHIDRIQNKPWYMQYNSYKSFSPKKDTEKQLFHGCPSGSARLIIHTFFNRSFAGINGTVYGQGAYFSANARYSHSYAAASTLNGERCMFVANVLVGDSAIGNTKMKTPPPGFESTTDGNHIFVTYRDDQAYAAYLIVYK